MLYAFKTHNALGAASAMAMKRMNNNKTSLMSRE